MANEATPRIADGSPATVARLARGTIVLGKLYRGEPVAKTFANRTQAHRAAEQAGPGWRVIGFSRPWFVAWNH